MIFWYCSFDAVLLREESFFFFFKWGVYFEVVFLLDAVCYEDIFYIVYI